MPCLGGTPAPGCSARRCGCATCESHCRAGRSIADSGRCVAEGIPRVGLLCLERSLTDVHAPLSLLVPDLASPSCLVLALPAAASPASRVRCPARSPSPAPSPALCLPQAMPTSAPFGGAMESTGGRPPASPTMPGRGIRVSRPGQGSPAGSSHQAVRPVSDMPGCAI